MDPSSGPSQVSQRDAQTLPRFQTSCDRQARRQLPHPRPAISSPDEKPYGNAIREEYIDHPNNSPTIDPDIKTRNTKRRMSRFGLAGLFSRTKPSDVEEKRDRLGMQIEVDETFEGPTICGNGISTPPELPSAFDGTESSPPANDFIPSLQQKIGKPTLKGKSSFKRDANTKKLTTWDPPPLFQAYPQAVRYSKLRAPSLSAEAILRLHINQISGKKPTSDMYMPDMNVSRKAQKEKKTKKVAPAEGLSKGDWTQKIFVLVTSGYFLQYAGDGNSDRLPEKIMPLTTESAAFASDVIPGQPYVLQISQVSDDQGTLDKEASRSMLKKLGLRNEMRRSATSFLLVLNSPEEMSAWLIAVRKEIQAIGGKEYVCEEFKEDAEGAVPQLQQRPSQRYLVKRDPKRFTEKQRDSPSDALETSNKSMEGIAVHYTETPIPAIPQRHSIATQKSVGSRSVSNATSVNQVHLDRLRESSRESYTSTGVKTTSTSQGSSPKLSPDKLDFELPDHSPTVAETKLLQATYPADMYSAARNSNKVIPAHRETLRTGMAQQQTNPYPRRHRRASSPTAPNFSVPIFSKRYSTANSPPATLPVTLHNPPSSPIVDDRADSTEKRTSIIGELHHLRQPQPSPKSSKRVSSSPQQPVGPYDPPTSSDCERPFSRRFSSLEYSRGVSPLQLARQSPSPHPPPTTALPAIPRSNTSHRASSIPPPTIPLPPIPPASTPPQRYSVMPSLPLVPPGSTTTLTKDMPTPLVQGPSLPPPRTMPAKETSSSARHEQSSLVSLAQMAADPLRDTPKEPFVARSFLTQKPSPGPAKMDFVETRKLRRPVSMQVRNEAVSDQRSIPSSQTGIATAFNVESLTPPLDESPPKPSRVSQPLPPQQSYIQKRITAPRIGREPPPVYSPATSPKPRISVSSQAESYFDGAAPHPFIPPIRVSERKFRGSLDGPWNTTYDAPQRTFFDLSIS